MEKPYLFIRVVRHVLLGWLFLLGLFFNTSQLHAQAPDPANLSVVALTQTSAILSWDCEPSENRPKDDLLHYDYVVSTNQLSTAMTTNEFALLEEGVNGVLFKGDAVEMSSYQLSIDGLFPGTTYYMLIRQNANDVYDHVSSWVMLPFNTLCQGSVLPVAMQQFDESLIPSCWVGAGEKAPVLQSVYRYGNAGNALKLESTAESYSYLFTPVILGPSNESELLFKIFAAGSNQQRFSVGIASASDIMSYVPVMQSSVDPGEWYDVSVVAMNDVFDDNYVWVIYAEAGVPSVFYIDNVEVHERPACVCPHSLTVTDVEANSAIFSWTQQGMETSWNLEFQEVGEEAPVIVPVNEVPFVYDGLKESTSYSVRVQANCGDIDGLSEWSAAVTFKTPQISHTLPFICDFENSVPWFFLNANATNAWVIGDAAHSGGNHSLYISNNEGISNSYSNSSATDVWVTQLLQIDEAADYLFEFDWRALGEGSQDYLAAALIPGNVQLEAGSNNGLSLGESQSVPLGWLLLSTERLNGSSVWKRHISEIHLQPGQYQLAFYWKNNGSNGNNPPAAIDNVSVKKIICPTPAPPTITSIEKHEATLVFPSEGSYNVKLFTSEVADPAQCEEVVFLRENVVGNDCQITGLNPNTVYYAYIQLVCVEENSRWIGPVRFITLCEVVEGLPFVEDFNTLLYDIPGCWDNAEGTTTSKYYKWSYHEMGYEGGCVRFDSYGNSRGNTNYLKTPIVSLTEACQLRFMCKKPSVAGKMSVYLSVDGAPYTDIILIDALETDEWQEYVVNLSEYTGHEIVVVFEGISSFANGDSYMYLDNVIIEPLPSCLSPLSFIVKDIMSTTAIIEVKDVDHTQTVDVEYGIQGFVLGNGMLTQIEPGDSTVVLTGLDPLMSYDVYVRNNCQEDGVSTWLSKQSFTTLCAADAVTAEDPFVEDFESYASSDVDKELGDCWEQQSTLGLWSLSDGEAGWGYSLLPRSGQYAACLPNRADSWMYKVVHLETGNYQMSCYAIQDQANGCTLSLGYGKTASTMQELYAQEIGNAEYQMVRVEFRVETAGDYVIGVRGQSYTLSNAMLVDDIKLIPVSCMSPTTPIVSGITDISAKVSWLPTSATTYNLKLFTSKTSDVATEVPVYSKNGISPVNGMLCDSIVGLNPQTTYYAYVQSVCEDGSGSEWSNPISFTTECSAIALSSTTPYIDGFEDDLQLSCWSISTQQNGGVYASTGMKHSGTKSIYAYKASIASPRFQFLEGDNFSNYQLSGFVNATVSHVNFTVSVMKNSDREGIMTIKEIEIPVQNEWREFVVNLSFLSALGDDLESYQYIEFNFTEESWIYMDDVRLEVLPSCLKPSNIIFGEINESSSVMDWNSNGTESQWHIVVKDVESDEIIVDEVTSQKPYPIAGLQSNTEYEVLLSAVCSPDDESLQVPITFKTSCMPYTLPFMEDFNYLTYGIPDCWDNTEGTTVQSYYKWSYNSAGYEGACVCFDSYKNVNGSTNVLMTPAMTLEVASRLSFVYKNPTSAHNTGAEFHVVLCTSDGAVLDTIARNLQSASWKEIILDLSVYTGQQIVVKFVGICHSYTDRFTYGEYLYLDNVVLEAIPSCEKPKGVLVSKLATEANITIEDDVNTAWEYACGLAGFDVSTVTPVFMSSNTATIKGLAAGTDYDLYVRAVCADDDKSLWFGPIAFSTAIPPVSLPYVCDFEDNESWTMLNGTSTNAWIIGSAVNNGGLKSLYISKDGGASNAYHTSSTSKVWAVKSFEVTEDGEYSFAFDWVGYGEDYDGPCDYMDAAIVPYGVSIEPESGNGFDATPLPEGWISLSGLNRFYMSDTWQSFSTDIHLSPGIYQLAFFWTNDGSGGTNPSAAIDNISISKSLCPAPTASVEIVNTTKAILRFALEGTYNVKVFKSLQMDPETSSEAVFTRSGISDVTCAITGLTAGYQYYAYVQAVCEEGNSDWSSEIPFELSCGVFSMPFEEDFDTWDEVSPCWTNEHTAGSGTQLWTIGSTYANARKAAFLGFLETGNKVVLATPAMHVEAGKQYQVSFYMRHHAAMNYGEEHINVYRSATALPTMESDLLGTRYLYVGGNSGLGISAGTYKHEFIWTQSSTEDLHIVFEVVGQGGFATAIDEVVVEEVLPCERPTDVIVTNVTSSTVDITINGSYALSWDVVIGPRGFDLNGENLQITHLESLSGTIAGSFTAGEEMELYVRSYCGEADGLSNWYGPVVFKYVDWSVVAGEGLELKSSGDYPWDIIQSGISRAQSSNVGIDNSSSDLTATFTLDDTERAVLNFNYYVSSEIDINYSYLMDYLVMYVDPGEDFAHEDYDQAFGKKGGESESGNYSVQFVDPGQHTVIWRYYKNHSSSAGDDMAKIWNVTLTKTNFYEPESLSLHNVSETSALLEWISSVGATQHQVRLIKVGVDTVYFDSVNETRLLLSSLLPNTEYKVDVRSIRGVATSDTTVWSDPLIFRTPYAPIASIDLPYVQDWEDEDENANWLLANGALENKWIISSKDRNAVINNSGTALYISFNDSANLYNVNNPAIVYAGRSFHLDAGAYRLSFDWKANGKGNEDYLRAFMVPSQEVFLAGLYSGTSAYIPEGWLACSDALFGQTAWNRQDQTIILEEGGYYNLVFMWKNGVNNGSQSPASVDNIEFERIDCLPVSDLKVSDRGADYIEVKWESTLTDSFQSVCVPTGTDIATVTTYVSLKHDSVRFEGLTENALYDIYVRSVCEEGSYSEWSFLTAVKAYTEFVTVPCTYDFESDETYMWSFANGSQTNKWYIGSAVNNGGSKALYISNNGGESYAYSSIFAMSNVYASYKFRATESSSYTISFDWMCLGETDTDYMQVYIAPSDAVCHAGDVPEAANWIALGSKCVDSDTWQQFMAETELPAGNYQLVFYWENNAFGGTNPPAAIDNINITMQVCMRPQNVGVDEITGNSARLFWEDVSEVSYELRVDQSPQVATMEEPMFSTVLSDTTLTVSDLLPNTEYYVALRSVCSDVELSSWEIYSFTTGCSLVGVPFHETFDLNPIENCWSRYKGVFGSVVSSGSLSLTSMWSHSSIGYGNMDEHVCLNIYGVECNEWLVSPSILVTNVENLSLCLDMSLNSVTGIYEPGAQPDDKFIVAVSTDDGRTWQRSNGRVWNNTGSSYVFDHISSDGEMIALSLSEFAEEGDTIRIAFYGESAFANTGNYLRIDNVAVVEVENIELRDSICAHMSYMDNGFNVAASELTPGVHHQFTRFEMAATEGESNRRYRLDLYVYPETNVEIYDTVCAGSPYMENGFEIVDPETRTYIRHCELPNVYGCDSMITLHLFVPETQYNVTATICEGDSYEFGGENLTESGSYTHTFAGVYCDSTVVLDLVVLPTYIEKTVNLCYGDSILFDNVWRKTSGNYSATYINVLGCDSTVVLHLIVAEELRSAYIGVLCVGEDASYSDDNFSNLTEPGEYSKTLTSMSGCDSVVTLSLIQKEVVPSRIVEEICEGEQFVFGDVAYNMSGEYSHTFESAEGCDSVVTLQLTVLPVSETEMSLEVTTEELPYEIMHNGEIVYVVEVGTQPGVSWPEITIEGGAVNGCDSIVYLTLTVKLSDALHLTGYEELSMWPNPIERGGKVRIAAEFSVADRENLKIEVFNSIGQCVEVYEPNDEQIYVDSFHVSGMYLVKVTTSTGKIYVGHVLVK